MILTIANVLYVLVAIAMIAFILLQRGAGAAAGSGFGGGASATVFGARGAANFLSKSTAVLAVLFFIISLGMAMYANRGERAEPAQDLGVMSGVASDRESGADAESDVPLLVPAGDEPASDVPVLPVETPVDQAPVDEASQPEVPEAPVEGDGND